MIPADLPIDEPERLAELVRYEILDTDKEEEFDELVKLAAAICDSEIALVSLVDEQRQWFKAKVGIEAVETPRDLAFCAHAIHGDDILEVPDATQDPRFHDNPLVIADPSIRFYAGKPLKTAGGYRLGTLCVIDRHVRQLSPGQAQALTILAHQVERQLELRLQLRQMQASMEIIRTQKQALERLNRLKNQILSVMSHDIRSPLAALEGVFELVVHDELTPEETAEVLRELHPQILQASQQVERLLQWSQQEIYEHLGQQKVFPLGLLMDRVRDWVQTQAKLKRIAIRRSFPPDLSCHGDLAILEIVLRNLLGNGIKYSRYDSEVELFGEVEGTYLRLGVKDRGTGITPENLIKILDAKTSVSTLGTAREKGTGLGLTLCQLYLERLGSRLEVVSVPEWGSIFSFLIPLGEKSRIS